MFKNEDLNCLQTLSCYIYHANKCNNCLLFNIFEHDKFHAQLSLALIKFYNLGAKFLANPVGVFLLCINALPLIQQFFNHVWVLFSVQRIKCHAQGHNTVPPVSLEACIGVLGIQDICHFTSRDIGYYPSYFQGYGILGSIFLLLPGILKI